MTGPTVTLAVRPVPFLCGTCGNRLIVMLRTDIPEDCAPFHVARVARVLRIHLRLCDG